MVQLLTSLVGVIFVLIHVNHAQVNPEWCPDGPTPPIPDPKWRTVPSRFEIMTELIIGGGSEVIEIGQAFSTNRDTIAKNLGNSILLFIMIYS
jgi:hypothetical protein